MTRGIARGDGGAFDRFYGAYFQRTYRYLLVLSRGGEDAVLDALQDTMLRVVRYMKPFEKERDLWNWLRMIARTAWIDRVRKGRRGPRHFSLSGLEPAAVMEKAGEEDAAEVLEGCLAAALERLDAQDRRLVEGRYFGGLSHEELAREHGVSRKAIESRLARIRKKLKGLIMERLEQ